MNLEGPNNLSLENFSVSPILPFVPLGASKIEVGMKLYSNSHLDHGVNEAKLSSECKTAYHGVSCLSNIRYQKYDIVHL